MTGRMRFLLGDEAQLQRVWRTFGIQPQEPDGREHSRLRRRCSTRDGVASACRFPVDQLTPEGLAHDLRALERSVLSARLGRPARERLARRRGRPLHHSPSAISTTGAM